jgi:transposase
MKYDIRKRAMIQALAADGLSDSAIAQKVQVHRHTVALWKSRDHCDDLGRSGRPSKLNFRSRQIVKRRLTSKKGASQRIIAKQLGVHHTTIGRAAKKLGLKVFRPRKKVILTESQRQARLDFANRQNTRDWKLVLFTDEKTFEVGHHPNQQNDVVYAYSAKDVPTVPRVSHPAKLHVAAAISFNGKTKLHIFRETLTGPLYVEILKRTIIPGGKRIFGDKPWTLALDNDPKHRSITVSSYLNRNNINYFSKEDWPANSPDLNPMDNVWSMLANAINKHPPRNLEQLETRLRIEWTNLSQEHIANTIDSMHDRLLAVKTAHGGHTKY